MAVVGEKTEFPAFTRREQMKIMIVEDDSVSLALLQKMLSKTDLTVVACQSAEEAWDRFKAERPRIVVSDWMLPELSGIDLCRKIREARMPGYVYTIIITAKDGQEDVLTAFEAGADDYVTKPFDTRELRARIKTGIRVVQLEDNYQILQKTLINSRNKIQTVFDALPEEIICVDQNVNLVSINKAGLKIMKGGFSEIIGQPCCTLAEGSGTKFYKKSIKKAVRSGIESQELNAVIDRYRDKERGEVIKERTVIPIMDDSGKVQNIVIVSRDISEAQKRNDEIQSLNQDLENLSSELINKNKKLENALENLERTQAQMVQSEKMASIGQLAAGVAHEINNPTSFVSSNLKSLTDYQDEMNRLIEGYRSLKEALQALPAGQLPEAVSALVKQVENIESDIDIEFILEDIGELIGDCREGTERIKKIVEDLKNFAHPGEEKMSETDINAGLESTLNVVNNELKYKATVVKEFGNLPVVSGFPQQLNQVFMNILVNAGQAIEKSGEIRIKTDLVDDMVEVRISDTGCGIPEEHRSRIFDPFFTTKEVGKGTGLGMNIAFSIVKKHKGNIRVESAVGKGTTFIIRLPATVEATV
jgi:PAS domain S-box-containing protein